LERDGMTGHGGKKAAWLFFEGAVWSTWLAMSWPRGERPHGC
jgi:hypothetical protein